VKKIATTAMIVLMVNSIVYGYTYSDYSWTTNPANGHEYALTLDYSNWTQAEEWAVEVGGHLATINDESENAFVAAFIKDSYITPGTANPAMNIAWIGLEYISGDVTSSDSWEWTSGESITFWQPGISPYYAFPQGGIHMYIDGINHIDGPEKWNNNWMHDDLSDYYPKGVIEIVPEPATLLLFGFGGLSLIRRKR